MPTQIACDSAHANLSAAIRESGADVRCEVGDKVQVRLSLSLLAQLLQNLIGNAIQYRRKAVSPRISVRAARQEKQWLFSVIDNGIGIDAQFAEVIFEPFRRLHGTELPGSGLGLATCKRIVERAGGKIWVDSGTGEGSTFNFLLPQA